MFTIRLAAIEQAEQVARIINAAFDVERPFRLRGERTTTEDVRRLILEGNTFFVAEEDHMIVGTVYARITGHIGYFGMLAVHPTLQRNGIGRALREHAEAFCKERDCSEMTLTTGDFRTELLPYYTRAGYRVVSAEPGSSEWSMRNEFRILHMAKTL